VIRQLLLPSVSPMVTSLLSIAANASADN
jgi:hypothetical protein